MTSPPEGGGGQQRPGNSDMHPWTRNKHTLRAWINAAHRVSGSSTAEERWQNIKKAPENQHQNNQRGTTKYQDCFDTIINSQS